jgi:hypothetical protein
MSVGKGYGAVIGVLWCCGRYGSYTEGGDKRESGDARILQFELCVLILTKSLSLISVN